jgi:phospholipid N-methyltransferase
MKSFFGEAIKSIKTTGSVRPSSRHLVKDCLKGLNLHKAISIVELGPGNGCFTEEIVKGISTTTRLFSLEINPVFFNYCTRKFALNKNVFILDTSALNLNLVLRKNSIDKVDYIISSLPLTIFKEKERVSLLQQIKENLTQEGVFVQYQYSLGNYKELKEIFSKVDLAFTVRNFPPAFVYKCYL